MAITSCPHGHRYDSSKFKECPYCQTAARQSKENAQDFLSSSIGLLESTIDRSAVAGWLVCVEGTEQGRDYRIKVGKNTVGRSWTMDISLPKDQSVNYTDHAEITYKAQDNRFELSAKGPNAVTLQNGKRCSGTAPLNENDHVQFGETKFIFVPYCKEDRRWKT